MSAKAPRTAAGRALHTWLLQHEGPDALLSPGAAIAAIEAEAASPDSIAPPAGWQDREPNHYDRFTEREAADLLSPEGLSETRRKFTEGLTDFYVHDAAKIVLNLLDEIDRLRSPDPALLRAVDAALDALVPQVGSTPNPLAVSHATALLVDARAALSASTPAEPKPVEEGERT